MYFICHKWGETNVLWKNADWYWSECQLIQEILTGVPGEHALPEWLKDQYDPYNHLHREKRERFVRMILKVKGYKNYNEEKVKKESIKIKTSDIKLVVKAVSGVDLKINESPQK